MIEAAGRSRLLELRREFMTAREGRDLLDRKREAILRAINDRLPHLEAMRVAAVTRLTAARAALGDAQVELGRSAIDAAAFAQAPLLGIAARETSVVGVLLPQVDARSSPSFLPRYGPASGSTALDRAGEAFAAAIPDLLAYASTEASVGRLRRALQRTVRRLNALDRIVLPELEHKIQIVASALEEEERDEAVRRERWRDATMAGRAS